MTQPRHEIQISRTCPCPRAHTTAWLLLHSYNTKTRLYFTFMQCGIRRNSAADLSRHDLNTIARHTFATENFATCFAILAPYGAPI
jgi:hypothetical protein